MFFGSMLLAMVPVSMNANNKAKPPAKFKIGGKIITREAAVEMLEQWSHYGVDEGAVAVMTTYNDLPLSWWNHEFEAEVVAKTLATKGKVVTVAWPKEEEEDHKPFVITYRTVSSFLAACLSDLHSMKMKEQVKGEDAGIKELVNTVEVRRGRKPS